MQVITINNTVIPNIAYRPNGKTHKNIFLCTSRSSPHPSYCGVCLAWMQWTPRNRWKQVVLENSSQNMHRQISVDWCTYALKTTVHIGKKLHHFIFAITLSNLSVFEQLLASIHPNKLGTKWHQNHQFLLKVVFILPCEMQHMFTCSVFLYCLEHLNETSLKVWKCMDQQCSAIVKHIIKCFSCLPLSLTYVRSLNHHWSITWSMTVCWMLNQSSFRPRRRLNSSIYRTEFYQTTPVALLRFCHLRTKVWNVMNNEVTGWAPGRYNWSPASCDKAAGWSCVHGALAHFTIKTYAGSPSLIIWRIWNTWIIGNLLKYMCATNCHNRVTMICSRPLLLG